MILRDEVLTVGELMKQLRNHDTNDIVTVDVETNVDMTRCPVVAVFKPHIRDGECVIGVMDESIMDTDDDGSDWEIDAVREERLYEEAGEW